jgi:hypothetical protein
MFLFNTHLEFLNYLKSFTLQLSNIPKLIIDLRGLCLTSSCIRKTPTSYPISSSSFSLLYLFHILYHLNRLKTLDFFKYPKGLLSLLALCRELPIYISLLLLLLLLKLLHRFRLIPNSRDLYLP